MNEALRSSCWAVAKPVALSEWQRGSADTTQMLISASRGLDEALRVVIQPLLSAKDAESGRLRSFILAIASHGHTTWSDTSMGGGGIGGQMLTGEWHGDVVDHLISCALRGDSLEHAADDWQQMSPGATRLDGPVGRSGRRGPDGRPRS